MTASAPAFNFKSEFDEFLFSPIREDKNGIELTVLSLLARQNVDPWEEAAKLARLPLKMATASLASLIEQASDDLPSPTDPEAVATRIAGLLPRAFGIPLPRNGRPPFVGVSIETAVFVGVAFALMALGSIYFASHAKSVLAPHNSATNTSSPR